MTRPIIAVFGGSKTPPHDPWWEDGARLGRMLVQEGAVVATGGYAGLMEAVSAGAHEAGSDPIGVTAPAVFPDRSGANGFVRREIRSETLPARIATMVDMADGAIALPGSLGTLAELIVAWNAAFVAPFRRATPKPVVTVGDTWRQLVAQLAVTLSTDAGFVTCVDDVDAAVEVLRRKVTGFGRVIG